MSEGQGGKPNIVKLTENWDSSGGEIETSDSKSVSFGAGDHGGGDHGGGENNSGKKISRNKGKLSSSKSVKIKPKPKPKPKGKP